MSNVSTSNERVARRTPAVEIFEDDQALWLSADLPGVEPGQVELSFDRDVLTLRARANADAATGIPATEFSRRFTIGDVARYDSAAVSAVLRHGVLDVRLPKAEHARRRQIPVTAA